MECPFCDINPKITQIIKDAKHTKVIMSNPSLMKGHLLVIPHRHVERISELTKEEQDELFKLTVDFQERILKTLAKGCDIRQNYRPFQEDGPIKRSHLHIHILPRELCDELYEKCQYLETELFEKLTEEEKISVEKLLKD